MFRSLHIKLVLILLLLITSLMTVVGAFLMTSVNSFYIDSFYRQIEDVFGDSDVANASFVASLREEASAEDGAERLQNMLEARAGSLGLNASTRCYYILDGVSGTYLTGSNDEESFLALPTSLNLLVAYNSIADGTDTVGSRVDRTAAFMDVAIPITGGENSFIIYIYDNQETVSSLNRQLFLIILQSLLVGLVISVLLSFLLSKTMIVPIQRLTEGAERVASGDFSSTIEGDSTDEIGILTATFNHMAEVLRQTLDEVKSERDKLDTLFLHMTDGVVAFQRDGSVLTCNPAASRMLGKNVATADYDGLFSQQVPLQQVLTLRRPNFLSGEITVGDQVLELYLAPFSHGGDGGIMVVLHDITAQRKNEEMRKEFVANVSHELRTPLTNVRSYAETLQDTPDLPPAMRENFLGIIMRETDRMTHIVQDLLTLSRLDSGKTELKIDCFPFSDAIDSVCQAVELDAKNHGHQLIRSYGRLPSIQGDRNRLEQVLMNVIGNAIKYTPDSGTITVRAGSTPTIVWAEVADTGIGIPSQDRERIFDRFYRVDKARSRESGGTGLGLSIAREIVLRHGGTIALVDHEGTGTTIRMELPMGQSNAKAVQL